MYETKMMNYNRNLSTAADEEVKWFKVGALRLRSPSPSHIGQRGALDSKLGMTNRARLSRVFLNHDLKWFSENTPFLQNILK